jgi:hypothetical protein
MVTINPSMVIGPNLQASKNTSNEYILDFLNGKHFSKSSLPDNVFHLMKENYLENICWLIAEIFYLDWCLQGQQRRSEIHVLGVWG